ncbi:hypothetical protein, partial [Bifidobacterium vansinderenii]
HRQDSTLAERQANFWARYSVAPPAIIDHLGLRSGSEVAEIFGLSYECGNHAFDAYMKWLPHRTADKPIDDAILDLYERGLLMENRETTRHPENIKNAMTLLQRGETTMTK